VKIPKPRRHKDDLSTAVPSENKQDEMMPEQQMKTKRQEKVARQREVVIVCQRKKGTNRHGATVA